MLASALSYCNDFGLAILPVEPGKKYPRLKSWKSWQNKKPDAIQIQRWWGDIWPGSDICLVCGEISNRIVIDIDTYKDKSILEKIDSLTPEQAVFPVADTPRGGEHRHFAWQAGIPNAALEYIDVKSDGGLVMLPPSGINGNNYKWREGCSIRQVKTSFLFNSYVEMIKKGVHIKESDYNHNSPQVTTTNHKIKDGSRDNTLFHIANHLVKSRMPTREIQEILTVIGLYGCETPFPINDIQIKINSAITRSQQSTIAQDIKDWVLATQGHFLTTDSHRDLALTTPNHKKAALMALLRLEKEGFIEKYGEKRGCYRRIDRDFELVQFSDLNEDEPELDIRLPFGLEKYIEVYPRDIIIYAGQPQVGKTAIMFECIRLNFRRHKIFYFSKELSARSVRRRVKKFEGDTKWDFAISDDFDSFTDVLQSNAINIIDYVEVLDGEYYKIPGILAQIHNRLKKLNSIAIVALQKNPDTTDRKTGKKMHTVAIGGPQTLAKSNLFCTLTPNYPNGAIMHIEKAKNPRTNENMDGWEIGYKIVQGINLIPEGIWEPAGKL
jgi:hypothetical protein